jgi:hypothetical protein
MADLSTFPTDPVGTPAQPGDLIPALRAGQPVALTPAQLGLAITAALTETQNTLLGRGSNAGQGQVQPISLGAGVVLQGEQLAATAEDHLALELMAQVDLNMEIVVNSVGAPMRLPFSVLLAYLQQSLSTALGLAFADDFAVVALL